MKLPRTCCGIFFLMFYWYVFNFNHFIHSDSSNWKCLHPPPPPQLTDAFLDNLRMDVVSRSSFYSFFFFFPLTGLLPAMLCPCKPIPSVEGSTPLPFLNRI
jgi:hypothetical protein